MRDLTTTILDALGLLLLAAGVGAAMYPLISWAALAVTGVVVLAGSWLAARQHPAPGGER